MVFLHGWGGNAEAFLFTAKRLANYRCVLVDFYGHGKTPHPKVPLTVADYALAVIEVMDCLNIGSATLIGHSFGGRVAVEIAAKRQNRVDKLVLVDSAGIKPRRSLKYRLKVAAHKLLKLFGKGLNGSADYRILPPEIKKTFINVVNYNQRPLLKHICAPTAIFWGEKDKDTPLYMAKIFNKEIKDSALFILTNGGHFSYLDNSGKFLSILSAFLKG